MQDYVKHQKQPAQDRVYSWLKNLESLRPDQMALIIEAALKEDEGINNLSVLSKRILKKKLTELTEYLFREIR